MKSLVVALALSSLLVTGACTAQTKRAGLVVGGVMTAAGSILAMSGAMSDCSSVDQDFASGFDCQLDKGLSTTGGVLTAAAGVVMLLAASAAPDEERSMNTMYPVVSPQPQAWTPEPAPMVATGPTVTVNTSVTVTTGDGTIDPRTVEIVSSLPVPTPRTSDPMLRQFTQQASVAARSGQCLAVRAIAVRVEDLDAAYRNDNAGFLRDPLVGACLN